MTLVGDPRIIFLDEPTTGLDPRSRRDHVADHPRPRRPRGHDPPDDALPGGGGSARRPGRGARPGRLIVQGTPDELKGLVPGGHVRLQFADMQGLASAARVLAGGIRDDDALTLQVPSDGDVRGVRALLDRLDRESIDVERISLHTPDLDDVFLALTGHSDEGRGPRS